VGHERRYFRVDTEGLTVIPKQSRLVSVEFGVWIVEFFAKGKV
jgi:hypothetical protein